MFPSLGPALALFLQGFVAMEVAYHLGPRNFRSNSESYKYVIAILLGTVVFAVTTTLGGETLAQGWEAISAPATVTGARIGRTVAMAIAVGYAWHLLFSIVVPVFYRMTRSIKREVFGRAGHYYGPLKVFDTAMNLLDGLPVEVFLKDGRVIKGGIKVYPDLDGDSGLMLNVEAFGIFESGEKWKANYIDLVPNGAESLVWVPGPSIEFIIGAYAKKQMKEPLITRAYAFLKGKIMKLFAFVKSLFSAKPKVPTTTP